MLFLLLSCCATTVFYCFSCNVSSLRCSYAYNVYIMYMLFYLFATVDISMGIQTSMPYQSQYMQVTYHELPGAMHFIKKEGRTVYCTIHNSTEISDWRKAQSKHISRWFKAI